MSEQDFETVRVTLKHLPQHWHYQREKADLALSRIEEELSQSDDRKRQAEYETFLVECQRNTFKAALEKIVAEPAEVTVRGDCAYCDSKSIARQALEDVTPEPD